MPQPGYMTQRFRQILGKHQLRKTRFRGLRHGCATTGLYFGCSLKDIPTWLGYSNDHVTAGTCIHSGSGGHGQMAARPLEVKWGLSQPPAPDSTENPGKC